MVKLTEQMVIARTKQSNLSLISKFNCCGASISDVGILRHMPNVTVLSLSVNNITSLEVFKYCSKLQELFVRRNNIKELNEVCYLQDLRCLKIFWLAENPCTKNYDDDVYRLTVIKALPRLKKLDNLNVEEHELERAQRHPRNLIHPEKFKSDEYYSDHDVDERGSESAIETEPLPVDQMWEQKEDSRMHQEHWPEVAIRSEPILDQNRSFEPRSSAERYSYESSRPSTDRKYEAEFQAYTLEPSRPTVEYPARVSPDRASPVLDWSQKSETEEAEDLEALPPPAFREDASREEVLTRSSSLKNEFVQPVRGSQFSSIPRSRTVRSYTDSPIQDHTFEDNEPCLHSSQSTPHVQSKSIPFPSLAPSLFLADEFGYSRRTGNQRSVANNCTNTCPRRTPDRKPNVLNAILCLVKELDYQNLAVVEHAVKSRMDELDDCTSH